MSPGVTAVTDHPLIEFRNIAKSFPGVAALKDVSFEIARGEVHALVGENGAGKSTLIKILSGVQQKDSGQILFDGREVSIPTPKAAFGLGVTCIYQELPLAGSLSIADNIFLGQEISRSGLLQKSAQNHAAREYFKQFNLDINPRMPVEKLSVSMQQITAIIKAMMMEARVFIMDEPTATLGEHEVDRLFDFIGRIKQKNITVLYISHRLDEIFGIADRVTVIRDGEYIGTRKVSEIDRGQLISMMSGKMAKAYAGDTTRSRRPGGKPVLDVKDLRYGSVVNGVSFTLGQGEIFGITGLVGAGKSEILKCIYGLLDRTGGEIIVYDESGAARVAGKRIASDAFLFGLVPEDRKREGLFLDLSLVKNVSISCLRYLVRLSWVLRGRENALAAKNIHDLDIKARGTAQQVKYLSGGNQQKVILSRWLNSRKRILLLDEPTRGVDVMGKGEIYRLVEKLSEEGISIIFSSADVGEVLAVADRVGTIRNGTIVRIFDRGEVRKEQVLHDILYDQVSSAQGEKIE